MPHYQLLESFNLFITIKYQHSTNFVLQIENFAKPNFKLIGRISCISKIQEESEAKIWKLGALLEEPRRRKLKRMELKFVHTKRLEEGVAAEIFGKIMFILVFNNFVFDSSKT